MQICTLTCELNDIGLAGISARLKATLDLPFVDESTNPDTLVLPSVFTWDIVDGVFPTVQLRETETINLAVLFEIFPLISPGVYSTTPIYKVYAIIPNLPTYDFAGFIDTGITNDQLSTGALRVAQVMFSNPALIGIIVDALNIYRQEDIPTSVNLNNNSVWIIPSTGDQWIYSVPLTKWLSFNKFAKGYALVSSDQVIPFVYDFTNLYRDVRLQKLFVDFSVQAPNDTENYWSFRLVSKAWNSLDTNPVLDLSVFNTSLVIPGERANHVWTLDRTIDLDITEIYGLQVTPVGTPGQLKITYSQTYRTIYGA